jgi:hypothetical protein
MIPNPAQRRDQRCREVHTTPVREILTTSAVWPSAFLQGTVRCHIYLLEDDSMGKTVQIVELNLLAACTPLQWVSSKVGIWDVQGSSGHKRRKRVYCKPRRCRAWYAAPSLAADLRGASHDPITWPSTEAQNLTVNAKTSHTSTHSLPRRSIYSQQLVRCPSPHS